MFIVPEHKKYDQNTCNLCCDPLRSRNSFMKAPAFPSLSVDTSLTPENAHERGYVWDNDIAYDETSPFDDLVVLVTQEGYKLGRARDSVTPEDKGLYRPLSTSWYP